MKESGRRFSGSGRLASLYAAECVQSIKTARHTAPHLPGSARCFDSRNSVFPKWKNSCHGSPKRVYAFHQSSGSLSPKSRKWKSLPFMNVYKPTKPIENGPGNSREESRPCEIQKSHFGLVVGTLWAYNCGTHAPL